MAKELKKETRHDRGVVVPVHEAAPYDPENIHLSKAKFIAKQKERKEKALKIAEFAAGLENPQASKEEAKQPEAKIEDKPVKKPAGRPKKIE